MGVTGCVCLCVCECVSTHIYDRTNKITKQNVYIVQWW